MRRLQFIALCLVVLAPGCGRELAPSPVNQPPETSVQADPPVRTPQGRSVRIYFWGEDADGDVVAYEWVVGPSGTMHDDVAWTRTTESSVEIVFDPAELTESDPEALQRTLMVRAIDNDGAVDTSPPPFRSRQSLCRPRW